MRRISEARRFVLRWLYKQENTAKCEHVKRITGLVLALSAVVLFAYYVFSSKEVQRLADLCLGVPQSKFAEPSRLSGYCNNAESVNVDSEDGKHLDCLVAGGEYELVHVTGVFRHGHRTPLEHVGSGVSGERYKCNLRASARWSALDDVVLWRLISKSNGHTSLHQKRLTFPLHPGTTENLCHAAQLTSIGFEQMAALGDHFWSSYLENGKVAGIKKAKASNFVIRSTIANRCMRSAGAFATSLHLEGGVNVLTHADGWFRAISPDLAESSLYPVTDLRCEKHFSEVQAATYSSETYKKFVEEKLEPLMTEFAILLARKRADLPRIQTICDNIQELYCSSPDMRLCRNATIANSCASDDLRRRVLEACDETFVKNYSLPLAGLLAHPLLMEIVERMKRRLEHLEHKTPAGHDDVAFALYFGHETTIVALLTTLESFNGQWPPLASRLLFELWRCRLPNCQQHKVRILFNGRPLQGALTDALGFVSWPSLLQFFSLRHSKFLDRCTY